MSIYTFTVAFPVIAEDYKTYLIKSNKTDQIRFIVYDAEKTKESDVDMYITFFKNGSTKLAWTAAKMNNIEVLTIDDMTNILYKKGCRTEECSEKVISAIPVRR